MALCFFSFASCRDLRAGRGWLDYLELMGLLCVLLSPICTYSISIWHTSTYSKRKMRKTQKTSFHPDRILANWGRYCSWNSPKPFLTQACKVGVYVEWENRKNKHGNHLSFYWKKSKDKISTDKMPLFFLFFVLFQNIETGKRFLSCCVASFSLFHYSPKLQAGRLNAWTLTLKPCCVNSYKMWFGIFLLKYAGLDKAGICTEAHVAIKVAHTPQYFQCFVASSFNYVKKKKRACFSVSSSNNFVSTVSVFHLYFTHCYIAHCKLHGNHAALVYRECSLGKVGCRSGHILTTNPLR